MDLQPARHLEIETKLDVPDGFAIPAIELDAGCRAAGIVAVGPPTSFELTAQYLDTQRLDLLAARVTLRRRRGGADDGWHLKLPVDGGRAEITLPLDDGRHEIAPPTGGDRHDHQLVPEPLRAIVRGATRGQPLRPVAELRTHRIVRVATGSDGRRLAEIADDTVSAVDHRAGITSTWREVEVERLDGPDGPVTAIVAALIAAGATPAGGPSKLGRALRHPGPAGRPAAVAGTTTAADVLRAAALGVAPADPEAVHDARVSARGIRSVLTVFDEVFRPGATGPLARALRRLGRALTRARDVQIAGGDISDAIVRRDPATAGQARAVVARHTERQLRRVHDYLAGEQYLDLLTELDAVIAEPPLATIGRRPPAEVLGGLVSDAWDELLGRIGFALAHPDDADALHRARKWAKTVRYAATAAAGRLGALDEQTVGWIADAEQVQDRLGGVQDAVTARTLLAEWADELALAPAELVALLREQRELIDQRRAEFVTWWNDRPPAAAPPD